MKNTKINYSQCWEDTRLVLNALNVCPNDVVFSITSGGDNSLAIIAENPRFIDVVDVNPAQNHLFELKWKAISQLNNQSILEFLGFAKSGSRNTVYQSIEPLLSGNCSQYWQQNIRWVKKGIIHAGKFEQYLNVFRKFILPLTHSKKTIHKLFNGTGNDNLHKFYHEKWHNGRWVLLFRLFFSERNLKKKGRGEGMFNQNQKHHIAAHYMEKAKQALISPVVLNSYYLRYILLSKYPKLLSDYVDARRINKIKQSKTHVGVHSKHIIDFLQHKPDNHYTRFNLSDVFEPLSMEQTKALFYEILRVAKNGARVLFWNNLVPRNVPTELNKNFISLNSLENELERHDRVFFYEKFYVYKVSKGH